MNTNILIFIARARGSKIHKPRRNIRSWWRRNHVQRPEYDELNRRKRREADINSKEGLGRSGKLNWNCSVAKRGPGCMRRCLGARILHPAQCHALC